MGARLSKSVVVTAEVDWESYVQAEWRSERSKELDRIGGKSCGMWRCAITLGSWAHPRRYVAGIE